MRFLRHMFFVNSREERYNKARIWMHAKSKTFTLNYNNGTKKANEGKMQGNTMTQTKLLNAQKHLPKILRTMDIWVYEARKIATMMKNIIKTFANKIPQHTNFLN